MNGPLPVVVPAGGKIEGRYAKEAGTSFRCNVPIGASKTPVLQRVVSALRGVAELSIITVAAPAEAGQTADGVNIWRPAGSSGPESIRNALNESDLGQPILICMSDLPFLTSMAVRDFVNRADPTADITLGLVRASDYDTSYPKSPRSVYLSLHEVGPVTLAGLFLASKESLDRLEPWTNRTFDARKSLLGSAGLLGPGTVIELLFRRLRLKSLVDRGHLLTGLTFDVITGVAPELAFDIDTIEDYEYANARIG